MIQPTDPAEQRLLRIARLVAASHSGQPAHLVQQLEQVADLLDAHAQQAHLEQKPDLALALTAIADLAIFISADHFERARRAHENVSRGDGDRGEPEGGATAGPDAG